MRAIDRAAQKTPPPQDIFGKKKFSAIFSAILSSARPVFIEFWSVFLAQPRRPSGRRAKTGYRQKAMLHGVRLQQTGGSGDPWLSRYGCLLVAKKSTFIGQNRAKCPAKSMTLRQPNLDNDGKSRKTIFTLLIGTIPGSVATNRRSPRPLKLDFEKMRSGNLPRLRFGLCQPGMS